MVLPTQSNIVPRPALSPPVVRAPCLWLNAHNRWYPTATVCRYHAAVVLFNDDKPLRLMHLGICMLCAFALR